MAIGDDVGVLGMSLALAGRPGGNFGRQDAADAVVDHLPAAIDVLAHRPRRGLRQHDGSVDGFTLAVVHLYRHRHAFQVVDANARRGRHDS